MWDLVVDAAGPDLGKWLALASAVTAIAARVVYMSRRRG
jgi:hypothetical protein